MQTPQAHTRQSDAPRRILITRLSAHGDVMHTLPLLAALKRQCPNAHVGWLVEASAAPLLEGHPLIDRLHVSQRKNWLRLSRNPLCWPRVWREISQFLAALRRERYEISLDAQGLLKSALWPVLAGIPRRYGFKHSREWVDWCYTNPLPPMRIHDASVPAIERYLDLARAIGCECRAPEFVLPPVPAKSRQRVAQWLGDSADERPLVVLAPFTRWASKHWIEAYWTELIGQLLALDVRVALLGASGDQAAAGRILAPFPTGTEQGGIVDLTGRTDWPDLYALFEKARLAIGLDSAPLHIANAVGGPDLIGLYGPTAPGRTGPIGNKAVTLTTGLSCQPCFERHCPLKTHDCMRQLTPAQVMDAVRRSLAQPQDEAVQA